MHVFSVPTVMISYGAPLAALRAAGTPLQTLNSFISFLTTIKSRHAPSYYLREAEMKSLRFKSITEIRLHDWLAEWLMPKCHG